MTLAVASRGETPTAADILHDTSDRIRAAGQPVPIIGAVCEAIGGDGTRPRDLTYLQATHLAEVLDLVESHLGATVTTWERVHSGADPWEVAWRLDLIGRAIGRETAA